MSLVRTISPRKSAQALSCWTGLQIRQAEYILGGHSGMSADALRQLIRTDHGFEVLRVMIEDGGEAVPGWWADFKHMVQAAELESRIAEERAKLRSMKRQRASLR